MVTEQDDAHVDPEVVRLKAALVAGMPDDPEERTEEERARYLLADLLEWHRREAKPAWWRYFRLRRCRAPSSSTSPTRSES